MRYLIDGHNLIGKLPDISLDDPNDEVELILRLKSWAAARRQRKVTVVFDGGLPGGLSRRLSSSDIEVIFAPEGRTADALLIRRIQKAQNPAEYALVSSDQQIIRAAEKRKMRVIRSEQFAGQMQTAPPPPQPVSEKDDPKISQSEVAEWLELFGPEPETKPAPRRRRKKAAASEEKRPSPPKSPNKRLRVAKNSDELLNQDDVDAWLELFGGGS